MSEKYKGTIVNIDPLWEDVKVLFVSTTTADFRLDIRPKPQFLFIYDNSLHFGICDYVFEFLQNYEDIIMDNQEVFNSFFPKKSEFEHLKKLNTVYYKLNYNETINQDLGDFSDYELELLKEWNRELVINKLLG